VSCLPVIRKRQQEGGVAFPTWSCKKACPAFRFGLIPSACLTCLFRLSPICHTCLPRLVIGRPAYPLSLSARCHRLSCPLSDIAAFCRRRVTPACPTTLSLLPVLQPCNSGLSYNLVFLPVMQYVISACLTAFSFLPVLPCHSCLSYNLVITACPKALSFLPVLRPCHSWLSCNLVIPVCPTTRFSCLSCNMLFLPVRQPCYSCLSYTLSFLPVLQPCHSCLS
jgi:hypothetical protein